MTIHDQLRDLRARLTAANFTVSELADTTREPAERARLYGKAEGIRVARGYVDEAIRLWPDPPCGHTFPDGTPCTLSADAHATVPGLAAVHGTRPDPGATP